MTEPFQTIDLGSNAVQIADITTGPILLSNQDQNNTIYLSYQQSIDTLDNANASTIPPLGSVEINPQSTVYAACASGLTAKLQITPDGSGYAPSPILIAEAILNSGTLLVDKPVTFVDNDTFSLAGGLDTTLGPFDARTLSSWLVNLEPTNAGGTTPFWEFRVYQTSDLAGAKSVSIEPFILGTSNANYPRSIGEGPIKGPYFWIYIFNRDSVTTTARLRISGTTRLLPKARFRTIGFTGFSSTAVADMGMDDVLGHYTNSALAAGASSPTIWLDMYNGPVKVRFLAGATSITANSVHVDFHYQPQVDYSSETSYQIRGPVNAAGTTSPEDYYDLYFPRRPVSFTVTNNFSAAVNTKLYVTAHGGFQ